MNPTPNIIPQDSGSPTRQQPKRLRGTSERKFTAVVQLVCGLIAVVCGLVLVVLKSPYNDNYYGYQITRIGKTAFGIWGGLVFIATAVPYFFGRHRKSSVGLYFGFCLASAVIAVVGLGLSITAINKIVYTTSGTLICNDEALGIQRDQKYRCCFDEYRYRYDCRPSYNHRFSWYDYHLPATYGYPRLNYNSLECESFRLYQTSMNNVYKRSFFLKMNPTPNVMSQDSGSPTRQQPKPLRGTSERNFTAVVQLVCGLIAVACGLVLVLLKTSYSNNYYGYQINRFGKTAFGIWGGLLFIATAIPYFFGRHRKSMVGLYFGFCLASAVIAVVGLGLSVTAINKIAYAKSGTSICNDEALGIQHDQKYRCCIKGYRDSYYCNPSYNRHYYWYDYHLPTTYGYQRLSYYSPECESFRWNLRDNYEQCLQEAERLYVPHLAFYGIMITVVSVELFASVYGACAALSALCNCCVGGKPTQHYPCSFNQLMVNDSLNNTVIPPQVTTQQPGPAVIATTEVPHIYTPLQLPS